MYLHEKSVITNKVHQENEVRKVFNKVLPDILKHLRPFLGHKILKADESLVKKFTDKIEYLAGIRDRIKIKSLPGMDNASINCLYVTASIYSIRVEVSCSFQVSDHGCTYCEGTIYLGDIINDWSDPKDNGNLKSINEYKPQKMLSAAGEWQKYESAFNVAEKAEKAKDKMFYSLRSLLA